MCLDFRMKPEVCEICGNTSCKRDLQKRVHYKGYYINRSSWCVDCKLMLGKMWEIHANKQILNKSKANAGYIETDKGFQVLFD